MKIEIEASGNSDYGDFTTIRLYFSETAWIEVDAADAHNLGQGPSSGASLTVHNHDGSEERVWDGTLFVGDYDYRNAGLPIPEPKTDERNADA